MNTDLSRLRPMGVSEIFGEAWKLYQENAALFLGVLAVLLIPQAILNAISPNFGAIGTFTGAASTGALIIAIADRYLGRDITVGQAYSTLGLAGFVLLWVTNIIVAVIVGIGLIVLIIPGIFLLVRLIFAEQAVVLERRNPFEAIQRTWQLTRGHWWRVAGIAILVFIISILIEGVVAGVLGRAINPRVAGAISPIIGLLIGPWSTGALTLLYYDLRLREEGAASLTAPGPVESAPV